MNRDHRIKKNHVYLKRICSNHVSIPFVSSSLEARKIQLVAERTVYVKPRVENYNVIPTMYVCQCSEVKGV